MLTPRAGYVELDADTYTHTFSLAVRGAVQKASVPVQDLSVLGLSAQGETLLCLDEHGQALRRVIVWLDNRAAAEAEELERHFGRTHVHATTGQPAMDAIWPACKILWLKRHEPELFARTAKFALLKDYLVHWLTGRLVGEDSLLCSTTFWDINTRDYWPEMLEYLGITKDHLPDIAEQGEIVGMVTDDVLKKYNLAGGLAGGVGLSMVAVAGVAVTLALIDKAGRRVFTVPPQWIMTVVFLVVGLWSGAPPAVVLGLFLVFSFLNAMNGTLTSIYPGEVFPTEVRCLGTGFAAAVSRIGAFLGTFLLPTALEKFAVSASMLAAAVIVFSGALVSQLWAPETKGMSLSETAHLYSH